jgi:polyisoprenyl-teichoic acid--peptidoglycan teichoic acid transferase
MGFRVTQQARAEPPASAPPPSRQRRLRVALIALAGALVLVVAAAAVYVVVLERSITSNIRRGDTLPSSSDTARPSRDPDVSGVLNYVLLGSDSRQAGDQQAGRSDAIMVVHLNAAHDHAYVISFPRDMWVTIPGHGENKINAAYPLGGPQLTVRTLEELTGVRMDHVVQIDFDGFVQLTKELGGVRVRNKVAFTSHGYRYPKGWITIKGKKALWFVRERHAFPRGDLDRAENQRKVLKAIIAKGLSPEVIADPARFTAFLGGLAKHMTVDQTLTDAEIRATALSLRLVAKNIVLMQAPLSGLATIDGQSVAVIDRAKMAELAEAMKKDTMAAYVKKYPKS